jgi:hypothetical protein
MDFRDTVTNLDDRADFHHRNARLEILNLLSNNFVNFIRSNWFHRFPLS